MTSLTGLGAFEWGLVALYALGGVLVVESRTRKAAALRALGFLVVPALSGLALWLVLASAYGHETRQIVGRIGDRGGSVAVALLTLATAVAFGDLLLGRLAPLAVAVVARLHRVPRPGDVALLLGVALPIAIGLACVPVAERHLSAGGVESGRSGVEVRARFTLPGHPMDIVFRDASGGYASLGEGSIARFELPSDAGGRLRTTTVATGLRYPRGIAIGGDTLFVAELGELPCETDFPTCKGPNMPGLPVEVAERRILRASRARVLAFRIEADGTLTARRTVIGDLPFANSDHGVNDLEMGPGGRVFVSVGNLDLLVATEALGADLERPHADLLGTIVSFAPDGSDLDVYAKGLRNVYGLAFDDRGRLYGADNDGSTRSGWRREEVLEIRNGGDYGYPWDGTYAPYLVPREQPLWVLDSVGSGGVVWTSRGDGEAILYVGSAGHLDALTLTEDRDGRVGVTDRMDVARLLDLPGYVTAVKERAGGLVLSVFTFDEQPNLYLLDLSES